MAEPSTSTPTPEAGGVGVVLSLGAIVRRVENPAPAPAPAPEPKRPEPTMPYSWRTFQPPITFEYVTDCDRANELLAALKPCPLGFDVEWKPAFLKGQPENKVALIQLANDEVIYLLQVSAMRSFPENLQVVLESEAYTKAGVGIQNDAQKVYRDCGVSMKSCVDLSLLARSVDSRWKGKYSNPIGLANLVATYEFLALGKGKITRSNWEAPLSSNQQEYAANDGHSGYTIYSRLIKMAGEMVNPPAETYYSFNVNRGSLCDPLGRTWGPVNPDYDPGPPPPPRPPKEKKDAQTEGGGNENPRAHRQPRQQHPRGYHQHQQQRGGGLNNVPRRLDEAVSGSSSGQTYGRYRFTGDNTEAIGGRGRGYLGPGPGRRPRGGGRGRGGGGRIGTFDKTGPSTTGD